MRVTVAGHACVDLTPGLPDGPAIEPGTLVHIGPLAISPGGCVSNTGTALAALGVPVTAVARVGADDLGDILRRELAARGVGVQFVADPGAATPYSIVVESPGVDRAFLHHVGAAARFGAGDVPALAADIFHLGYPAVLPALTADAGRPLAQLLQAARAAGAATSLDLSVVDASSSTPAGEMRAALETALPFVDVISPSVDDLGSIGWARSGEPADVRRAGRELLDRGPAIVMLSAGPRGAALLAAGGDRFAAAGPAVAALAAGWAGADLWQEPAPIDAAVSTNGAGDTMSAGLLYGILQRWNPDRTAGFALRLAAERIQGHELARALAPDDRSWG